MNTRQSFSLVLWCAVAGAGCSKSDSQPDTSGDVARATIGPAGGQLVSKDGAVSLHVPAGALDQDVELAIAPAKNAPVGGLGKAYDFLPHGTTFEQPVSLVFNNDYTPAAGAIVGVGMVIGGRWVPVPTSGLDGSGQKVLATTQHFSTYGGIAIPPAQPACNGGSKDPCLCDEAAWKTCCEAQATGNPYFPTSAWTSPKVCVCANPKNSNGIFDCYEDKTGNDFGGCTRCERDCCTKAKAFAFATDGVCGCSVAAADTCLQQCAAQNKAITKCEAALKGGASSPECSGTGGAGGTGGTGGAGGTGGLGGSAGASGSAGAGGTGGGGTGGGGTDGGGTGGGGGGCSLSFSDAFTTNPINTTWSVAGSALPIGMFSDLTVTWQPLGLATPGLMRISSAGNANADAPAMFAPKTSFDASSCASVKVSFNYVLSGFTTDAGVPVIASVQVYEKSSGQDTGAVTLNPSANITPRVVDLTPLLPMSKVFGLRFWASHPVPTQAFTFDVDDVVVSGS